MDYEDSKDVERKIFANQKAIEVYEKALKNPKVKQLESIKKALKKEYKLLKMYKEMYPEYFI